MATRSSTPGITRLTPTTRIQCNWRDEPENKYYYPGGTIGGPVLIPWTKFNRNRNKLFFFTGYEYFYQVLDTGLLTATVPTPGEFR